jgi:DNA invertase Pin-like site-specific DNA recombinase
MVFTILGAVAELERSLIVERVKAGLRNARARVNVSVFVGETPRSPLQ